MTFRFVHNARLNGAKGANTKRALAEWTDRTPWVELVDEQLTCHHCNGTMSRGSSQKEIAFREEHSQC